MEQPNVNISNATNNISFYPSTPSNCINGTRKGLENMSLGILGSIAFSIAAPIKGGMDGYEKCGVGGACIGVLVGSVVGALGATVIAVGGTVSCLWQTTVGLVRTPNCIYSMIVGKHWDDDVQEWVKYDLPLETNKLSTMTEDEFSALVAEKGSAYEAFSVNEISSKSSRKEDDGTSSASVPKKNILDRELYDVLGVEPEASTGEIKKAYYLKARQSHPDRNPGDETAKANFQRIGQAYQVLADEKTRAAYDSRGKSSLDGTPTMDAAMLYTLIFGSEAFESVIGELDIAARVRLIVDPGVKPPQIARFRQRKRELACALALLSKVELFVSGEEEVFADKARKEAEELGENPLGCALLGVIGLVYMQRASAKLSSLGYLTSNAQRMSSAVGGFFSTVSHSVLGIISGLEMRSIHAAAEARQKEEDDRNQVSEEQRKERKTSGPLDLNALYGPDPTPEYKESVRLKTKKFTSHLFGVLWYMVKSDVQSTVKHVCNKLLRDSSVSSITVEKRARALHVLGKAYCDRAVSEQEGLEDFLTRMGANSGLFGKEHPASSGVAETDNPLNPTHSEEGGGHEWSKTRLMELVSRVEEMGVRELKESIAGLGGDASDCVEKTDLRNRLNDLIAGKLYHLDEATHTYA